MPLKKSASKKAFSANVKTDLSGAIPGKLDVKGTADKARKGK